MPEFWVTMWLTATQETWALKATPSELTATIMRMHAEFPENEISVHPAN